MGRQHAKIISKQAFEKAFVEGEVIMRRNLARLIEDVIELKNKPELHTGDYTDGYIDGLKAAQEIVFGKVERDES
jgi:hypothetical protein